MIKDKSEIIWSNIAKLPRDNFQHTGGIKLEIKNFKGTVENKLGNVNPLVEQSEDDNSPLDTYGIFDDIENDLMKMSDDERKNYLRSIISFCQDLLGNSEFDDNDGDDWEPTVGDLWGSLK